MVQTKTDDCVVKMNSKSNIVPFVIPLWTYLILCYSNPLAPEISCRLENFNIELQYQQNKRFVYICSHGLISLFSIYEFDFSSGICWPSFIDNVLFCDLDYSKCPKELLRYWLDITWITMKLSVKVACHKLNRYNTVQSH